MSVYTIDFYYHIYFKWTLIALKIENKTYNQIVFRLGQERKKKKFSIGRQCCISEARKKFLLLIHHQVNLRCRQIYRISTNAKITHWLTYKHTYARDGRSHFDVPTFGNAWAEQEQHACAPIIFSVRNTIFLSLSLPLSICLFSFRSYF